MNKNGIVRWLSPKWFGLVLCMVLAGLWWSCNNDDDNSGMEAYDPSRPVVISDFSPKTGGSGQRLILYGNNFGNDPDSVQVYIGGQKARVIGVKSESLYCLVPKKAFSGEIELYRRERQDGDEPLATAQEQFVYEKTTVVSTLCGYKDEYDDQGWNPGKFDEVTGFAQVGQMTYDPLDSSLLYICYDAGAGIYRVSFTDSTVTKLIDGAAVNNVATLQNINFTRDGQYMVVAQAQGNAVYPSVSIMSRAGGFTDPEVLIRSRGNRGLAIHPVNGELYFSEYQTGNLRRYDIENSSLLGGTLGTADYEDLLSIQDINWAFHIEIHPTGNYAYIVVSNQHYILRTDYNPDTKRFKTPYVVCGEPRESGYNDGVGTSARLNVPFQGVFVKNPDYAGQEDEYDFYFVEQSNHDVRILKPDGRVSTFAGRGKSGTDSGVSGYIDGEVRSEARFNTPTGIAYAQSEKAFYVMDEGNRCIRKIQPE